MVPTVIVPATSDELSVKDIRVVQLPDVVVVFSVVVVIGPVGESVAETVPVLVVASVSPRARCGQGRSRCADLWLREVP